MRRGSAQRYSGVQALRDQPRRRSACAPHGPALGGTPHRPASERAGPLERRSRAYLLGGERFWLRGGDMIRFGPAGWTYKDWEGVVYPKPKPKGFDPLKAIASLFDTIELNTSFYAPITPHNADLWLERTAFNPDFRFTAKLWRRFTHERDEPWTEEDVRSTR